MNRRLAIALLALLALVGCLSSTSKNVTPKNSDAVVIARATTWEWNYPGYSIEAQAPLYSLPRVSQSDCGSYDLVECAKLWQNARKAGPPRKYGAAGGVRPPRINPFWLQTAWAFDGNNTTGCASDANNCTTLTCGAGGTNSGPCLTYAEILARWGTLSPIHSQSVTISYDSQANADDPVGYQGILPPNPPDSNGFGPTILFQGNTSTAFTTTISSLTAKNTTSNTRFVVNLGTATQTQYQLIVNTTRGNSVAWVGDANVSTAAMSQPAAAATLASAANGTPLFLTAINDTWAATDAITVLNLPQINGSLFAPIVPGVNATGIVIVYRTIFAVDPPATGGNPWAPGHERAVIGSHVELVETGADRSIVWQGLPGTDDCQNSMLNDNFIGGFQGGPVSTAFENSSGDTCPLQFASGVVSAQNTTGVNGVSIANAAFWHNVMFVNTSSSPPILLQGTNYAGTMKIDTGSTMRLTSGATLDASGLDSNNVESGLIWGTGTLDAGLGVVKYSKTRTAATTFPITHLDIQGQSAAVCCATAANPSILGCSLALSTTNLAAACSPADAGGLGNAAFLPTGGSFVGF